jgi:chromosome segregation ATPase
LQTIASVDENLKQKYLDQQRLIEKFVLLSKSVSHQKSMIKEVQSDALRDLSAYFSEFSKPMENAKSIHLKESQATSELTERIDSLEKVKSDLERKIQGKSVQYEELYEILNNAKSEILMIAESQNIPVSVDGDSGFEVLDSLRYIFDDLTADMNLLRDENEKLRSESTNFKRENTELSAKVAKLENEKEQLEISYQVLEDQMNQLKSDVENERNNNQKLNEQNTFLLGHQNPNQKIQHIKQLKDEVTSFKKRCREQEMLIRKYKRVCGGNVELSDDEQNLLTEKSSANDENGNIDPNLSSHLKRYNLRNH